MNKCYFQTAGRARSVAGALAGFVACAMIQAVGCGSADKITDGGAAATRATPSYATVASGYNARVAGAERLTSQISVIIEAEARDESGAVTGRTRDQLEGNLSIVRPQRVALRLDKVGQNVAYLGCDERSYWWFDMAGKEPTAIVGTHRNATPRDAADFGLPVHPLEFIELLGVLPLPSSPVAALRDAKSPPLQAPAVRWSKDGRLLEVTAASRWGTRKFTLDPVTYEPSRIDLLDERGALAVGSVLSRFAPAAIEGKPGSGVPIATKVELSIPANTTRVLMVLADPRIPLKVRPKAFDVTALIEAYSIKNFIDHDEVKLRRNSQLEAQQAEDRRASEALKAREKALLEAAKDAEAKRAAALPKVLAAPGTPVRPASRVPAVDPTPEPPTSPRKSLSPPEPPRRSQPPLSEPSKPAETVKTPGKPVPKN